MNANHRRIKDEITKIAARPNETCVVSKVDPTRKAKVQNLRSHSPTLECLTIVRTKLNEYLKSTVNIIPTDHISKPVTPEESRSSDPDLYTPPIASPKKVKSRKTLAIQPMDKVTYEAKQTRNGDLRQKCSVEIWLPHAYSDIDDDAPNTTGTLSPVSNISNRVYHQSEIPKSPSITAYSDTRSENALSSNNSETVVTSYVPCRKDIHDDRSEERIRSSKTVRANKSFRIKRSRRRRLSQDTHQSTTTGISLSSKIAHPDVDQIFYVQKMKENLSSNTNTTINDPLNRSPRGQANQRMIRTKKPFEHVRHSSGNNAHITRELRAHQTVAFRIILGNALPLRSAGEYNIMDPKLLNSCSSNSETLPTATHYGSKLDNHRVSTLPTIQTRKIDDSFRNVNNTKSPSRLVIHPNRAKNAPNSMTLSQNITNGNEHHPKRSLPLPLLLVHPEQRRHSIVSINRQPIHFKYSKGDNTNCTYLTPK
ncbi:unnamed protein product [Adineta ricciae]|uniref:Uncharacterized protein n=1 Tax=Adineta ricciae TaxID=249248 RepID=A0A814UE44_ADIRI|nr:unnamed protein product [Adineta ricciae]CAF1206809.1 unnamed protein product [Adineta ricciae]